VAVYLSISVTSTANPTPPNNPYTSPEEYHQGRPVEATRIGYHTCLRYGRRKTPVAAISEPAVPVAQAGINRMRTESYRHSAGRTPP
jgi:hypothetical protein